MADPLQELEKALGLAAQKGDVAAAAAITRDMQAMLKEVNPDVDAPVDPTAEGARMAAKDTGTAGAVMASAGRKVSRIGEGIGDLVTGNTPSDETRARRANEDQSFAALRQQKPFSTAGGEALPYVAVPASMGLVPAALTVGALEGAEPGTAKERLGRATVGAVTTGAGGLLAKGGASFLAPVTARTARPSAQAALAAGERLGRNPTLSEATGSTWLRRLEDTVAQLPGGGGVMADHAAGNAVALNRAAARAIGETADELTPEVFSQAAQRIGKVFEDVKALPGKQIQLQPSVVAAADEVLRLQAKMLPHQQDQNLIKIATEAKNAAAARGRIDGETYQVTRSGLSDAAFDATVGTNKQLYGKLLNALDDSAEASLRAAGNDALADAMKVARPEWANLKILEKGLTVEAGNVSPAKVASTMRANNPGAFRRGNFVGKEMGDLAAVGEGLKPLREGSQTFARGESNPLLAAVNAAWSYPVAKALTSPVATMYPRLVGSTAVGRQLITPAARIAEPSGRAAVAAALQQSGLLPLPVAAEQ